MMKRSLPQIRTDSRDALAGNYSVCFLALFFMFMANMALTALVLEALIVLTAWAAYHGRMPFLLLAVGVGGFVLNSFLNYGETTHFALWFLIQGLIGGAWAVLGTAWMLWEKEKPAGSFLVKEAKKGNTQFVIAAELFKTEAKSELNINKAKVMQSVVIL